MIRPTLLALPMAGLPGARSLPTAGRITWSSRLIAGSLSSGATAACGRLCLVVWWRRWQVAGGQVLPLLRKNAGGAFRSRLGPIVSRGTGEGAVAIRLGKTARPRAESPKYALRAVPSGTTISPRFCRVSDRAKEHKDDERKRRETSTSRQGA